METMQVQDLIDILQRIEDKSAKVNVENWNSEGEFLGAVDVVRVQKTDTRLWSIITE